MFAFGLWSEGGFSLAPYREVLLNKRQFILLSNSLILAGGTTALSLLFGVPLAFFISRTDIYFRRVFKYLYLAPLLIPPYITTLSWIALLGKQGQLTKLLIASHLIKNPVNIYGLPGAIWVLGLSYFPFLTLLTITGLTSVDRELEEAGQLSHTKFGVLKGITLPLVSPYIISGAIFVFIFSISNYGVPALLEVNTYPVEIFTQFSAFYSPGAATAISLPLFLITMVLILLQRQLFAGKSYVGIGSVFKEPKLLNLGRFKTLAFIFTLLIIFVSVLLPLIILIIRSGSLLSYKIALKTSYRELLFSLGLAAIGATLIILMGFFISYLIERTKGKRQIAIDIISLLPFAIPATVLGIGLIRVWNRPLFGFIYSSSIIILFGYIARFSPFTIRAISSNLKQISLSLEESASICGVRWWRRFFRILIPLSKPGLLAGWMIAFILSLGELGTTLLVIPPGEATLPIKIYNIMHYGASKLVAALSIILIIASLLTILFVSAIFSLRRRKVN
jgi:iron(III) transport system permease protein